MKVGHMDGMHCFIDSTSILVEIKSVLLYNCRNVYKGETKWMRKGDRIGQGEGKCNVEKMREVLLILVGKRKRA